MKLLKLIFTAIVLFIANTSMAQYDSLVITSTCGDSAAFGVYQYDTIYNGKPSYIKGSNCLDFSTSVDCDAQDTGPFYIRWTGNRWEWYDDEGCIWLVQLCVPKSGNGLAYRANNYADSLLPPCFNWVPEAGYCAPIITGGYVCNIVDQSVSGDTTYCDNGVRTITLSSTQSGLNYYLRNDSDNSLIDGPLAGTDSSISLLTGIVSSTTTYNVYASRAVDSANCNMEMSTKITVTINNSVVNNQSPVICIGDSVVVGTNVYKTNGNYNDTLSAANGCDSIINTNLTVNTPLCGDINCNASIDTNEIAGDIDKNGSIDSGEIAGDADCNGSINGSEVAGDRDGSGAIDGTEIADDADGNGALDCNDLALLGTVIDTTITNTSPILTANASGATYQWLDCNNSYAEITNDTNQSFTATSNGSYAVKITYKGCTDTSACEMVLNTMLENAFGKNFNIFPNPTNKQITLDLGNTYPEIDIVVRNTIDQVVLQKNYRSVNRIDLLLEGEPGIYSIEIKDGNQSTLLRVIKE